MGRPKKKSTPPPRPRATKPAPRLVEPEEEEEDIEDSEEEEGEAPHAIDPSERDRYLSGSVASFLAEYPFEPDASDPKKAAKQTEYLSSIRHLVVKDLLEVLRLPRTGGEIRDHIQQYVKPRRTVERQSAQERVKETRKILDDLRKLFKKAGRSQMSTKEIANKLGVSDENKVREVLTILLTLGEIKSQRIQGVRGNSNAYSAA